MLRTMLTMAKIGTVVAGLALPGVALAQTAGSGSTSSGTAGEPAGTSGSVGTTRGTIGNEADPSYRRDTATKKSTPSGSNTTSPGGSTTDITTPAPGNGSSTSKGDEPRR